MPEQTAPDANQGEHAAPRTLRIDCHQVRALMAQHIGHDLAPAGQVAEGATLGAAHEGVPACAVVREWLNYDGFRQETVLT